MSRVAPISEWALAVSASGVKSPIWKSALHSGGTTLGPSGLLAASSQWVDKGRGFAIEAYCQAVEHTEGIVPVFQGGWKNAIMGIPVYCRIIT